MKNEPSVSGRAGASGPRAPESVAAVVLTHRRPRLATEVVRSLVELEGLPPERVVVVVNGSGGLDDASLEARVRMVRLPHNLGPAGGFGAGMAAAFADPSVHWAYLCEDDVGLFSLPSPRLADIVGRAESTRWAARPTRGGGCRLWAPVRGSRIPHGQSGPSRGERRGAGSRRCGLLGGDAAGPPVFDAGIVPDAEWFFGLEDFDFFCRVRQGGFEVLVDAESARAVADQQTSAGRDEVLGSQRPTDESESWRSYYHSRNSVLLARRHGRPSWHVWHLAYAARHLQKATGRDQRRAILRGLWDGALGRFGENPEYGRTQGELAEPNDDRLAGLDVPLCT